MTERCEQCGSSLPPGSPSCPICGFDRRAASPAVPVSQGRADPPDGGWAPTAAPTWGAPAPTGVHAPSPAAPPPGAGYPVSAGAPPLPQPAGAPPAGPSGNRTLIYAAIGVAAVVAVLALVAAALVVRQPDQAAGADTMAPVTATSPPITVDDPEPSTTRPAPSRPSTTRAVLWTPWQPPDRSFTIDFTGQPQVETMPVDGQVFARGFRAASETRRSVYLVGWFDAASPRYLSDSALMLNLIADGYAQSSKLTFTHRAIGHFAGNPSLDFAGTIEEGGETVAIRALELVSGLRVFLFVAGDTGDGSADFDHFRDSFRISG